MQLHLACKQRIGVSLVGPSGSGKTTVWRLLQGSLTRMSRDAPVIVHILNPKVLSLTPCLRVCGHMNGSILATNCTYLMFMNSDALKNHQFTDRRLGKHQLLDTRARTRMLTTDRPSYAGSSVGQLKI